jgi:hypothetical protein
MVYCWGTTNQSSYERLLKPKWAIYTQTQLLFSCIAICNNKQQDKPAASMLTLRPYSRKDTFIHTKRKIRLKWICTVPSNLQIATTHHVWAPKPNNPISRPTTSPDHITGTLRNPNQTLYPINPTTKYRKGSVRDLVIWITWGTNTCGERARHRLPGGDPSPPLAPMTPTEHTHRTWLPPSLYGWKT